MRSSATSVSRPRSASKTGSGGRWSTSAVGAESPGILEARPLPESLATEFVGLDDPRWDPYVGSRPEATFFHRSEWQRIMARTYGYAWHGLLARSEEHTSELQSLAYLVCRLLLEKKNARETDAGPRRSQTAGNHGSRRQLR